MPYMHLLEMPELVEQVAPAGSVMCVAKTCRRARWLLGNARAFVAVRGRRGFAFASGADVGRSLARLSAAYTVRRLELPRMALGDPAGTALAAALGASGSLWARELWSLELSGNALGDAAGSALAAALRANSALRSLGLSDNGLGGPAGLALAAALRVNCSLQSLDLADNVLDAGGGQALALALVVNSTLASLSVAENRTLCAFGDAVCANSSLQSLDLRASHLRAAGVSLLGAALRVNSALRSLDLSGNMLGDTPAIARLVRACSLSALKLCGVGMHAEGALALADALLSNSSLLELQLSRNRLQGGRGAVGARFRDVLVANSSLDALDLGWNALPCEDIVALAGGLRHLRTLRLSGNLLGEPGARSLGRALAANCSLRALYLDHCGIEAAGGSEIASALRDNSLLQELDLSANGALGRTMFTVALQGNRALQTLRLEG